MAEKDIKAHVAKIKAQISGEAQPAATVEETTTQAPVVVEEEVVAPVEEVVAPAEEEATPEAPTEEING